MLRLVSWIYFGLAAINVIVSFNTGLPVFIAGAIALVTVGIVLLAFDKIIDLLADIRAALVVPQEDDDTADEAAPDADAARPISDLAADIDQMKAKVRSS